jgi:hypothetical protein
MSATPSVVRSLNLGVSSFYNQLWPLTLMQEHRLTMLDFLAYHSSEN